MDHIGICNYLDTLNLSSIKNENLDLLFENAQAQKIPALRPQSCRLLYLLLKMKKPLRILEIGTGSGISALWMMQACPDAQIITLERDKNRFLAAQNTFEQHPNIKVLQVDVFSYLDRSQDIFDCIFMDAQKRDYIDLLPLMEKHCRPETLMITDNILFGGKVVQESLVDERKYRSGVDRLKLFNTTLAASQKWESFSLPIEDGLTLSLYRDIHE